MSRSEGVVKLISALSLHHQYAGGGALHPDPIGNNDLARQADVDKATASAFFKREFGGHAKYKTVCRQPAQLAAMLKHLNGEYTADGLFGGTPPGEGRRDDD
jgi:hypothetical protein